MIGRWTHSTVLEPGHRRLSPAARLAAGAERGRRRRAGPVARPVAAHPPRGDDRARGRARAGRAGDRPAAGGHPAALGHLGGHRLRRAGPPGPAWCSPAPPATPGPGCSGWARPRCWRPGTRSALLWALLGLLALLLVQIRNWYGLWSVLVSGGLVLAATWWLPAEGQAAFAARRHLVPAAGRAARRAGAAAPPAAAAGAGLRRRPAGPADPRARRWSGSGSSCWSTSAPCCSAAAGCWPAPRG